MRRLYFFALVVFIAVELRISRVDNSVRGEGGRKRVGDHEALNLASLGNDNADRNVASAYQRAQGVSPSPAANSRRRPR